MPDESDRLPAVPDDAAVEEMVFDGEVIDGVAVDAPPARRLVPAPGPLPPRVRWLARQAGYVAAGAVVALRRRHEHKTRHKRMMRAATAAGDHEAALKWEQAYLADRKERRENRESLAEMISELAGTAKTIGVVTVIVLAVAGCAVAYSERSLAGLAWPVITVLRLVKLAIDVAAVAWTAGPPVVLLGGIAWLHHLGRHAGREGPGWIATTSDADDVIIDETTIAQALGALRIPQVRDYLKDGLPLQFITPCRVDGRGTYFEIRLPKGVPAEKIVRRRADFASGLYRLPKEVWPTVGSEAAILKGWIADKGALEEGAGPYPLAGGGLTDVFKGLPFGRTLRGDPVRIPVIGRNSICGGAPSQGKSNAARNVAVGYALDVVTELRVFVPDLNFDFEPFRPRCSRYVMGAEDEHIERIMGELEELKDEIQRRGQLLIDYEQQEVTRELAYAGVGLHPMFWLLEEAHVAIQHDKYGKPIGQLLCDVVKLDRKRGIHVMVSTQAPTKDSMPRDVTRNCTVGIAFAVGDHVANDALLGQGAYAAGHRATELIMGADVGTALCKGFSGERSEMVQVHKLDVKRDNDQVSPLVARAMAEIARKGREVPGAGLPMIEQRDLLTDLVEVTLDDAGRVNLADLPPRLRKIAPGWGAYKKLTGVQLRQFLEVEGVRVYTTGGTLRVDPADLGGRATGPTGATLPGQDWVEELDD